MHALRVEHQIGERQREQLAHFVQRPIGAHFAEARDQLIGQRTLRLRHDPVPMKSAAKCRVIRTPARCARRHAGVCVRDAVFAGCQLPVNRMCQRWVDSMVGAALARAALAAELRPVRRRRRRRHRSVRATAQADLPRNEPACARLRGAAAARERRRRCVCGACLQRSAAVLTQLRAVPLCLSARSPGARPEVPRRARVRARARRAARAPTLLARAANRCRKLIVPVPLAPRRYRSAATTRRASSRWRFDARTGVSRDDAICVDAAARNAGAGRAGSQSATAQRARRIRSGRRRCRRGTSRSSTTSSRPAARCTSSRAVLRQAGAERVEVWAVARAAERRGVTALEEIFERDADEHRHAEVVVVEECAQALLRLALANQQLLVQREDRRDREPDAVPQSELQLAAGEPQREQASSAA